MAVYFLPAERAIALSVPQCARVDFDLRTCKTAMSQMRDSLSAVVKERLKARIRAFFHPYMLPIARAGSMPALNYGQTLTL
jgi:hypothetical protein